MAFRANRLMVLLTRSFLMRQSCIGLRLCVLALKSFPFRVSISLEYALNQPGFDPNSQTLEIRPIFEREQGRLYLSINPDLSVATKGPDSGSAPAFEPNAKIGWDFTKVIS